MKKNMTFKLIFSFIALFSATQLIHASNEELSLLMLPNELQHKTGQYLADLETAKNLSMTSKESKNIGDVFIDASLEQMALTSAKKDLLEGQYDTEFSRKKFTKFGFQKAESLYKKYYDNYFTKFASLYFSFKTLAFNRENCGPIHGRTVEKNFPRYTVKSIFYEEDNKEVELELILFYKKSEIGELIKTFEAMEKEPTRIITTLITVKQLAEEMKKDLTVCSKLLHILETTIIQDYPGNNLLTVNDDLASPDYLLTVTNSWKKQQESGSFKVNPILLNVRDGAGDTLLHAACRSPNRRLFHTIEWLVKNGAEINTENKQGETPLYLVFKNDHTKAVELLLQYGANPNTQYKEEN